MMLQFVLCMALNLTTSLVKSGHTLPDNSWPVDLIMQLLLLAD